MPFVRVNCGVNSKGSLIEPIAVDKYIRAQKDKALKDWYVSPYIYGDEALDYWNANGNSIASYTGSAWTDHVYWDLDLKGDLPTVRNETIKLVKYLVSKGFADGIEVFFSGNKGFHVTLKTTQTFEREQLSRVASGIIKSAGVLSKCFDTSVYNTTRILRYVHTRHQESGLYKIPLEWDQLTGEIDDILELAEISGYVKNKPVADPVDLGELYTQLTSEEHSTVAPHETDATDILAAIAQTTSEHSQTRRCVQALEDGNFGPSERDNALIRLAAFYRATGVSEEDAFTKMTEALEKRAVLFPEAEPFQDSETQWKIDVAYGSSWKGGMYSCKTDELLQSKCGVNGHYCYQDRVKHQILGKEVVGVGALIRSYVQAGEEAHESYPKFGIQKLDKLVRIRPKNFSVIAGAAGVGKTSIIIQMLDSLNEQKVPHLFVSLDMADSSLLEKLAARHTPYSINQIEQAFSKHTRNEEMIREIAERLMKKLPFTYFDFVSSMSMKHLENTIVKLNQDIKESTGPVKVVFIDYAGRMMGGGDNAYANATANALMANDVAKNTESHLMFISQIAREQGDHTTPLKSSRVAKDTGSWEENATFVLTCWRPFGAGGDVNDSYYAMYLGKNRSGGMGEMHFHWDGKTGSIREMTTQEYNDYASFCEVHGKDAPPKGDHPEGADYAKNIKDSKSDRIKSIAAKHYNGTAKQVKEEAREQAYDTSTSSQNTDADDQEEKLSSRVGAPRSPKVFRSTPRGP